MTYRDPQHTEGRQTGRVFPGSLHPCDTCPDIILSADAHIR